MGTCLWADAWQSVSIRPTQSSCSAPPCSARYFVNTLNWAAGDPPGLGNYESYLDRHSAHRHFILTNSIKKFENDGGRPIKCDLFRISCVCPESLFAILNSETYSAAISRKDCALSVCWSLNKFQ